MEQERLFMGLYSGSAADGVDAALVSVRGEGPAMSVQQVAHVEKFFPEDIRCRLRTLRGDSASTSRTNAGDVPRAVAELDRDVAIAAAKTGEILFGEAGVERRRVEAVGWSGQIIACEAPGKKGRPAAGLEIGSAAILAERLGCPVVDAFAASDRAAGGVGGPVTAWCDWLLFRDERLSRVVVRLGGVATVTFIPAAAEASDVSGYDVGPGTCIADELAGRFHHQLYDADGAIAASGAVKAALLNELMAHPYIQARPPKQSSPGEWSQTYLWRLLNLARKHACEGSDLLATVTELTARLIAQAVAGSTERPHEVILAGGGAMNIHLAGRIRHLLSPSSTYTAERYGLGIRSKQAVCYAILAAARMDGQAAHCRQATGARKSRVLGAVTMG